MTITITGANGSTVSLADGTGRGQTTATALQYDINNSIATNVAEPFDLSTDSGNPDVSSNVAPVGIIQNSGTYQIPSAYQYVVVADDSDTSTGTVALYSNGFTNNNIKILAGRQSGIVYNANTESGIIENTAGSLTFNGAGQTGKWVMHTGDGDSTINATDGNNQINTGTGNNKIVLGTGNNSVYSEGQDTISGSLAENNGYQSVTLAGSQSELTLGANGYITDVGDNNTILTGKNSTVAGGAGSTYTFNGGGTDNRFQGGVSATVNASNGSDLTIIHGDSNTYTVDHDFTMLNGNSDTSITVNNGKMIAFGSSDSNYTVNAGGSDSGLFVANTGNETLNASGSATKLEIYANTVVGGNANLVATGGSADDVLVAGVGNSTFSGGAGNNLFMFTKAVAEGGNTVITDFSQSAGNKIALFNYGLDNDSLTTLLQNSQNDASGKDAVLNLEGHTITIQGVAVSDLNTSQFAVANTSTNTTV